VSDEDYFLLSKWHFISNKQKYHAFLFLFSTFFFYKKQEQEGRTLLLGRGLVPVGAKTWWGQGRRVNTVKNMYSWALVAHTCNPSYSGG
jgi:hypothetical protein